MKIRLLKFLVCPSDSGALDLVVEESNGEDVKSGFLVCKKCQCRYPIKDRVPRFVSSDDYVGNFSLEWSRHATTQLDSVNKTEQSYRTFIRRTGFTKSDLESRLVLDVGCGSGRFIEVARKLGAEVVGIDLSFAVDAARRNFSDYPKTHIIQADIFKLPFKPESFDHIYSMGVLHHTRDTRLAFNSLIPYLKSSGKIAIWVYNNWGIYNTVSDFYRLFTTRMPRKWLYKLCRIFIPAIHFFHRRSKIWRYLIPIPIDYNSNGDGRILNTFDWYSPKYQWKHNVEEVKRWFEENKLEDITVHEVPVSVSGRKLIANRIAQIVKCLDLNN